MAARARAAAVHDAGTGLAAQRRAAADRGRERQAVLRPGGFELVGVVAGTLAMLVIALAGLRGAVGQPVDAGVALAVETGRSGSGAPDGTVRVVVRNSSSQTFTGTVVGTAGKTSVRETVRIEPRTGAVVELRLPGACGASAHVMLDGPGSDGQAISMSVPCAGQSS